VRFGRRGRECRRGPRPGGIGHRIAGTRRLVPAVLALLVGLAGGLLPAGPGATAAPIPARDVVGSVQSDRVSQAAQAQTAPQPGFALESLRASRVAHPAYSVDVLYPRLTGLPGRVGERVNARIAAFVDETAARFKAEVKALPSLLPAIATGPSTLIGGVTTDFDSAQIVSVGFSEYTYSSGAAHGITVDTTFNFDALTGRQYRLADLFNPSSRWLVALSRLSRRALSELLGSLTSASWIDSGTTPKESNFAAWALTPWGLQIAFGDYQVAAYAAGMSQITIPYASLAAMARASGPLALAAEEAASVATGPSRMPLLPEVSQPASGECDRPLLVEAKGPIPTLFMCPGGRINVAAWDDLSQYLDGAGTAGLRMITLSGTPSLATVRAVMCADLGPGTFIDASTEVAVEQLAAKYHGWRFPSPPAAGFPGFCHEGK
jgi:hypothetical protein